MSYYPYTNVPNSFFSLLPQLGYAELKVLLVIIRQTYGFVDPNTKRAKQFDWISGRLFVKKAGLSQRSVSEALSKLLKQELICIKNEKGKLLTTTGGRIHAYKCYYRFIPPNPGS